MVEARNIVIYHGGNCPDGFTAAWVAWKLYGDSADYLPAKYGDPPPDVTDRHVRILDFSYPRATLLEMHAKATSLAVLDHHKTAEADLAGLDFCKFDMNRSGAGLAWDVLHADEPRPKLVDYVEDRDLWRFSLPDARAITAYVMATPKAFEAWSNLARLVEDGPGRVAELGQAILRKIDEMIYTHACETIPRVVAGHAVPVVNASTEFSEIAGKLAEGALFSVAWFQRGDGKYQYSLRSRGDFDVSEIAKLWGGGGHKNAAGFVTDWPPDVGFPRVEI